MLLPTAAFNARMGGWRHTQGVQLGALMLVVDGLCSQWHCCLIPFFVFVWGAAHIHFLPLSPLPPPIPVCCISEDFAGA